MKHSTTIWSLLLSALCGCSDATQPPAEFSQRLSTADRLVVTNRYAAFGTTFAGAAVSRLAKAIKSAKQDTFPGSASAHGDWDVEFYAGTNYLAVVHLNRDVVLVGNTQYRDGTGVVMAFGQELATQEKAP